MPYASPTLRAHVLATGAVLPPDALPVEMREELLVRLTPLLIDQGEAQRAFEFLESAGPAAELATLARAKFEAALAAGRFDAAAQLDAEAAAWIGFLADLAGRQQAAAERLHARLRRLWGFPDPKGMTMLERFQARYRGKRYSFGYPACPDLAMQEDLFRVLDAGRIGVRLTDGHMMEPEASVSALVFHHPAARYFSV